MSLFNLVEQQHAVGLAAHGLGEVTALLVAHIAGRRPNQAGDRVLLHEFAHVNADQVVFTVKQKACQRLAQLGLSHTRRAKEQEGAGRAVRIAEARTGTADGIGDCAYGLILADHALMQFALHQQQLVALTLHQLADRNTGGTRDNLGNLFGADLGTQQLGHVAGFLLRLGVLRGLQPFFKLGQLAVLQLGDLVEVALAGELFNLEADTVDLFHDVLGAERLGFFSLPDFVEVRDLFLQLGDLYFDQPKALLRSFVLLAAHGFTLDLQLDQAPVEAIHHLGLGVHLDLDLGRRLVDQVNSLVGQKAVGDIAMAEFSRSHDGRVGDLHAMVNFVFFLQPAQDGNGGFHRGLVHQDLLEAAFQGGVLFNVLAVFVQGGGTHAMQLATRQRGLEHVAGIHGAFCLAGAHHGVQLVDKDDGLAFILGQFIEHGFQALFKLAAKLGPGQQGSHVQ